MIVDHINRQRNDNRKENLRICTQKENMQNVEKDKLGRKLAGEKISKSHHKNGILKWQESL